MKIADFEDRIAIEAKHRIGAVWAKMLNDFDIKNIETETRFVEGFKKGCTMMVKETEQWLNTPNVKPESDNKK